MIKESNDLALLVLENDKYNGKALYRHFNCLI